MTQSAETQKKTCRNCGKNAESISAVLSYCNSCIYNASEAIMENIKSIHGKSRSIYGLPEKVPQEKNGAKCRLCGNECSIDKGKKGYCNIKENKDGRLKTVTGSPLMGKASYYLDHLPTNCVGDWVCPGGSEAGYPEYSNSIGPEYGYNNMAVFYEACSFNCLFCQNWHFKIQRHEELLTPSDIASKIDRSTSCMCFFGGDPSVHMAHSIKTALLAVEKAKDRILRICWETNGSMKRSLLKKMAEISLKTGGLIKFDLKAMDEKLHMALTGVSNKRTLDNFAYLSSLTPIRPIPPPFIASTLIIPGYVEAEEIGKISRFIASLDISIPYTLLIFHPRFYFTDLPSPTRKMADECLEEAKKAGLTRVKLGNVSFLKD